MNKTICIDFDGVIHRHSKGWQDGTVYDLAVDGALDSIRALQDRGYAVVVSTARKELIPVANWMRGQGYIERKITVDSHQHKDVPFWNSTTTVLITNRKIPAIAYIDDRGITFRNNWSEILDIFKGEENE